MMYRPYEPNLARQQIPSSVRADATACFIEAAYADSSQNACGIDPARLSLFRAGVVALTGREQERLRQVQYPEV